MHIEYIITSAQVKWKTILWTCLMSLLIIPDSVNVIFAPSVNCHSSNTFYYNFIRDWNTVPQELRKVKNINKFKTDVKKYLLGQMKKNFTSDFTI